MFNEDNQLFKASESTKLKWMGRKCVCKRFSYFFFCTLLWLSFVGLLTLAQSCFYIICFQNLTFSSPRVSFRILFIKINPWPLTYSSSESTRGKLWWLRGAQRMIFVTIVKWTCQTKTLIIPLLWIYKPRSWLFLCLYLVPSRPFLPLCIPPPWLLVLCV